MNGPLLSFGMTTTYSRMASYQSRGLQSTIQKRNQHHMETTRESGMHDSTSVPPTMGRQQVVGQRQFRRKAISRKFTDVPVKLVVLGLSSMMTTLPMNWKMTVLTSRARQMVLRRLMRVRNNFIMLRLLRLISIYRLIFTYPDLSMTCL